MQSDKPTFGNIGKELFSRGYWERARERNRKSKTVWDLVFAPIALVAMDAYWYALTKLFLWLHIVIYRADAGHMRELMGGSITLAQALIFVVPMFSVVPLGFITSNFLMWLVPPARRAAEEKAQGVKWAGFRDSQVALFKMALIVVPIGVLSGIAGALILGR